VFFFVLLFVNISQMQLISISILSYIVGMFPTALIIVYLITGKDVRRGGSNNMGAMNTMRIVKKEKNIITAFFAFLLVWFGDMGKAILTILIAQKIGGTDVVLSITLAAFFVILGHNYPFILKFKGGRGAASLMGILLYFNKTLFLFWVLIIFLCMTLFEIFFSAKKKKIVSWKLIFHAISEQIVGRLIGEIVALIPFFIYGGMAFYPALAGTILVIVRHRDRLINQLKKEFA